MPSLFNQMTSLTLCMLHSVGILVEPYSIRRYSLPLVLWALDSGLPVTYIAFRLDWLERCYLLSLTPGVIFLLPFLFLPSTFLKMPGLMVAMSINCFWAYCNILDAGFCSLRVVLQWGYKFYTVLLELHTHLSFETTSYLKYSFPF